MKKAEKEMMHMQKQESIENTSLTECEHKMLEDLLEEKNDLLLQKKELLEKTALNVESEQFFGDAISILENSSCIGEEDKVTLGLEQLEVQEAERKRIARDLHDSTIQNLTALTHKIELCLHIMDRDSIQAKLELQTVNQNLRATISEMRGLIYNLRPMSIDDLGMEETICRFFSRVEENAGIKVNYHVEGQCPVFKPVVWVSLFRVIQESCNNVIKHANAKHIDVKVHYGENWVEMCIKDDGQGFDVENWRTQKKQKQFGLSMMQERVFLLNGEMTIQSKKNKGTALRIKIPVSKEICND